jgi:uncharacterized membrane protein
MPNAVLEQPAAQAVRPAGRILTIDALRGLSLVLMMAFHFTYDLVFYCGFPRYIITLPAVTALQVLSSRSFILLAGISCRLSRSNLRRGFIVLGAGALVQIVSGLWGDPIHFGILQFMGCSMLIYGMTDWIWQKMGNWLPVLCIVCFVPARLLLPVRVGVDFLFPFGFLGMDFRSSDYFPLLPWFFLFLFGTWLGGYVRERRGPAWLYRLRAPGLNWMGRHSLLIYLVHQPVLVALAYLLAAVSL